MKSLFKKISAFAVMGIMLLSMGILAACKQEEAGTATGYGNPIGTILENGYTDYSVVIPAEANEALLFATEEFVSFAFQSSGARFSVLTDDEADYTENAKYISVGNTKLIEQSGEVFSFVGLRSDAFFIRTVGQSVFLVASNDRGIIYSSYDFLEKFFGIRFLTYDDTYIPKVREVPLYKLNITENPAFEYRTYLDGSIYKGGVIDQNYTVRMRASGIFSMTDAAHGGSSPFFQRLGHDHNFIYYVPESIYKNPLTDLYHPEFYMESTWPGLPGTICLSSGLTEDGAPELVRGGGDIYRGENGYLAGEDISVLAVVIDEMKKDILANPDKSVFMFLLMDGTSPCVCEACLRNEEKYMRSGHQMRFTTAMLNELRADPDLEGREFKIVTYAYGAAKSPPLDAAGQPLVHADSDNIIRMALGHEMYYSYADKINNKDFRDTLFNWEKCADDFMFWGYDRNFHDYISYIPTLQNAGENIRTLREAGVSDAMLQSTADDNNNWQSMMNSYVYHKLMWNPDLDSVALKNEYIDLHYGAYAGYIRRFIAAYEEYFAMLVTKAALAEDETFKLLGGGMKFPYNNGLPKVFLLSQIDIIKQAEAALDADTSLTSAQKEAMHKKLARVIVSPMASMMHDIDNYFPSTAGQQQIEFVQEFFNYCDYAGVIRWQERASIETWKAGYGL